jgi:hypothetical protein
VQLTDNPKNTRGGNNTAVSLNNNAGLPLLMAALQQSDITWLECLQNSGAWLPHPVCKSKRPIPISKMGRAERKRRAPAPLHCCARVRLCPPQSSSTAIGGPASHPEQHGWACAESHPLRLWRSAALTIFRLLLQCCAVMVAAVMLPVLYTC